MTVPFFHSHLTQIMDHMGYDIIGKDLRANGVCFGLDMMEKQAFLVGDIELFNYRLSVISDVIGEVMTDCNREPTKKELDIIAGILSENHSVCAFLDGVKMYFKPPPEFFEGKVEQHDYKAAEGIVGSAKLEACGGLTEIENFICATTIKNAKSFWLLIDKVVRPHNINISFAIATYGYHAINFNFDSTTKEWYLFDSNGNPLRKKIKISNIGAELGHAYGEGKQSNLIYGISAISTVRPPPNTFLSPPQYAAELSELKLELNQVKQKLYKKIAPPTAELTDRRGMTLLHIAVAANQEDLVDVLLKQEPNLNHLNIHNMTPFHLACEGGNINIVKKFIKHEPSLVTTTRLEQSMLSVAVDKGNLDLFNLLIGSGVDIEQTDDNGNTALQNIISRIFGDDKAKDNEVRNEMLKILLNGGANANHRNKRLSSPIIEAIRRRNMTGISMLLEHGVNLMDYFYESSTRSEDGFFQEEDYADVSNLFFESKNPLMMAEWVTFRSPNRPEILRTILDHLLLPKVDERESLEKPSIIKGVFLHNLEIIANKMSNRCILFFLNTIEIQQEKYSFLYEKASDLQAMNMFKQDQPQTNVSPTFENMVIILQERYLENIRQQDSSLDEERLKDLEDFFALYDNPSPKGPMREFR